MSDSELGLPVGRSYEEILKQRQDDEGYKTATTNEQCLDSSRPWLCFWILHSLAILEDRLENEEYSKIAGFLAKCQSPTGGFGGGPGQYPHLASTYAAVNALCTIGTQEAYNVIDRKNLKRFLSSLRGEDGSFCMHENGEVDIRGAYCALAAAKLTNVYTPDMFKDTAEWIAKCQTWEGGFGGCPGMEAHGGYAYCALAALVMLGKTELCNLPELLVRFSFTIAIRFSLIFLSFFLQRWIVNKQMRLEGGFQGRTNKLVDGCYSFWQGGTFPLISAILSTGKTFNASDHWLFHQEALQEYILTCCQNPHGGLLDKPGKNRDIYHTCYVLSGLSVAQNSPIKSIIGMRHANKVEVIHPVYNVEYSAAKKAQEYFLTLPIPD
ncbi:hypothetical protein ACFW04_005849 [Cataglyphis niger]